MHWDELVRAYPKMARIFGHDLAMDGLLRAGRTWQAGQTPVFADYGYNKCRFAELDERRKPCLPPVAVRSEDAWAASSYDAELDLAEAVEGLGERARRFVRMYYYEGMQLKDIGRAFGLSESAVSLALKSARRELRRSLGGYDDA